MEAMPSASSAPRTRKGWHLDKGAERLEGGHGLQVDRYLLGITAQRPAVYDLDIEAGEIGGCPCGVDFGRLSGVL
jgi:hypothetical protein